MSVGAYAFATKDWKELEYPLDLWVRHNAQYFDKISLGIEFGTEIDFELPSNVRLTTIGHQEYVNDWLFYTENKAIAMNNLDADWKMMLDIDEFVNSRVDETKLDKRYVYGTKNHHLFGNIRTEILYIYPDYYWRLHYGNHTVLNDGGSVDGKRKRILRDTNDIFNRPVMRTLKYEGIRRLLTKPSNAVEIWHTNTVRSPKVLYNKWLEQSKKDPRRPDLNVYHLNKDVYESDNPYQLLYDNWQVAKIKKTVPPKIILGNANRFANFEVK